MEYENKRRITYAYNDQGTMVWKHQSAGSCFFNTPQYKELLSYIMRNREALEESLTVEQKELFEKLMVSRNEFDSLAEAELFAHGFRLGVRIMLEMLS